MAVGAAGGGLAATIGDASWGGADDAGAFGGGAGMFAATGAGGGAAAQPMVKDANAKTPEKTADFIAKTSAAHGTGKKCRRVICEVAERGRSGRSLKERSHNRP